MTADQIRVVDFKQGQRFRIVDREHKFAGRSGTLEFDMGGVGWMRIDGEDVPVKLEKLVPVALRGV